MITFNAEEIYEMAEQIERNGAKFYRKAAGATDDEAGKKLLLELAGWEDEHEKTFVRMKSQLAQSERLETAYDPSGEGARYLHAMVQGRIFDFTSDPSDRLTGGESLEEVFRTAIELEKDSILYYLTMKKMVTDELSKGRVDEIIEQEMAHIATLSKQLITAGL